MSLKQSWARLPDKRLELTGSAGSSSAWRSTAFLFHMEHVSMSTDATVTPNVKQAVPFFMVTDIEASLRFYVDGLGFTLTHEWRPEKAAGRIQWCWLQLGDVALMLQEYWRDGRPGGARRALWGKGSQSASCARTR